MRLPSKGLPYRLPPYLPAQEGLAPIKFERPFAIPTPPDSLRRSRRLLPMPPASLRRPRHLLPSSHRLTTSTRRTPANSPNPRTSTRRTPTNSPNPRTSTQRLLSPWRLPTSGCPPLHLPTSLCVPHAPTSTHPPSSFLQGRDKGKTLAACVL